MAPSDYEHIFKGDDEQNEKQQPKDVVKKIPSDTPTALIAPSDFEHIYRDPTVINDNAVTTKKQTSAKNGGKSENPANNTRKVPSRFAKPYREKSQNSSNKKQNNGIKPHSKSKSKSASNTQANCSTSSSPRGGSKGSAGSTAEVLPQSITMVVKRFLDKQKKAYTINK